MVIRWQDFSDSLCAVSVDLLIFISNRFTREEDESARVRRERERERERVFRAEYNNALRLQSP